MTIENQPERKQKLYNIVMFAYLIISLFCLPIIMGEALVQIGWVDSIYKSKLPQWLVDLASGYEILLLLTIGAVALIAWIPAVILCITFRRSWRILIPSVLLVIADASLILLTGTSRSTGVTIFGVAWVIMAFFIGLEWLVRRYFLHDKDSGNPISFGI